MDPINHVNKMPRWKKRVRLTLRKVVTKGFSKQVVIDLDKILTLVVRGFSCIEGVTLDGIMVSLPVFRLTIDEFIFMLGWFNCSSYFNLLFDRSNTLFLDLEIDD